MYQMMQAAMKIGNGLGGADPSAAVQEFWQTVNETLTATASVTLKSSVGIDVTSIVQGISSRVCNMFLPTCQQVG